MSFRAFEVSLPAAAMGPVSFSHAPHGTLSEVLIHTRRGLQCKFLDNKNYMKPTKKPIYYIIIYILNI